MSRATPKYRRLISRSTFLLVAGVFLLSSALWAQAGKIALSWEDKALRVWMFDIGQGDALFIQFPTGEQWLIDGGPDDSVLAKLGSLLPPWDRSLDAILLTHPDADHVTGLVSVLDRYKVETIYETGVRAHTPPDEAFAQRRSDSTTRPLQTGDKVVVGDVRLTVVWPDEDLKDRYQEDRNNHSMNFLLEYGDTRLLFTGDSEAIVEEMVGPRADDVDVLKIGHHGSLTSSSWDFVQATTPEVALISMGRENAYGHPHPIVIQRLEDIGAIIFRTDLHRDILLTSYGNEPQVQPWPLPF